VKENENDDYEDSKQVCMKRDEGDVDWISKDWWSESGNWLQRQDDACQY